MINLIFNLKMAGGVRLSTYCRIQSFTISTSDFEVLSVFLWFFRVKFSSERAFIKELNFQEKLFEN
jgi:hypothetical protein